MPDRKGIKMVKAKKATEIVYEKTTVLLNSKPKMEIIPGVTLPNVIAAEGN